MKKRRVRDIPSRLIHPGCFCCRMDFDNGTELFEHLGYVPMGDAVREMRCSCCEKQFDDLDSFFLHYVHTPVNPAYAELERAGLPARD